MGTTVYLPGGVEPIAEGAGEGEELELPQDATKFLKKKQPSKKVKKGRTLSMCCHLLSFLFYVSLQRRMFFFPFILQPCSSASL